jgi:CheY-like chemotaxis protein
MTEAGNPKRRRLLVVEDEYFVAKGMVRGLRDNGVEVVGPVGDIDAALDLIDAAEHLDGAVVDLNLNGEMAYPVADALLERGIPFVFATGYDKAAIPPRYAHVPRCEKPVTAARVVGALAG